MTSTPYYVTGGPSAAGASRLDTAERCLRLYAYKYRMGLYRSGSAAQGVGSLIHAGLAQHYARMGAAQPGGIDLDGVTFTDPERIATWEQGVMQAALGGDSEGHAVRTAKDTIAGYIDHYRNDRFRVLHVEGLYSVSIPDPARGVEYPFTARVDLVTEGPDGKVYLWDHKSTGRIEGKHATAYSMSIQIVGHRWLAQQAYGAKFGGYVLNMIQTQGSRFERPPILAAPALVAAFPATVIARERRLADLEAAGTAPMDYPAAMCESICVHRYGACPAIDRCCWGTST